MRRVFIFCVVSFFIFITANELTTNAQSAPTLRQLADRHGLLVGVCANRWGFARDVAFRRILAREFNVVTCENAMKMAVLCKEGKDVYDFSYADAVVDLAQKYRMQVHGHTLVWHNGLPKWLDQGGHKKKELRKILRAHIFKVMRRYRGRVQHWDVVNEAIDNRGGLRTSLWKRALGQDYVAQVFLWAHEADPDALLFYNDYGWEEPGRKADDVYGLLKQLVKKGVPIHGAGMQMHMHSNRNVDVKKVRKNVARVRALGLKVWITELDVPIVGKVTPAQLEGQADSYRKIASLCRGDEASRCDALIMWGMTDKYSWVPKKRPGQGAALIFDENYTPKPAYYALQEALK